MSETNSFVVRDDRRPVNLRGFAISDSRDCDITVADLSYGGCQIHCADALNAGEVVELRVLKRGSVQAEIRWSGEGRAGAQFLG